MNTHFKSWSAITFVALVALVIPILGFQLAQIETVRSSSIDLGTCLPPPANLVSWWLADGDASDIVMSNNGLLKNGAAFTTGMVGSAFNFDGVDDYVAVSDDPSLNPIHAITVDAWINRSSLDNDYGPVVVKRPNNNSGYTLEAAYGDIAFHVYVSGRGYVSSPFATLPTDQWVHVAGVYDGSTISLYLNGNLIGSNTSAPGAIHVESGELGIGHDQANPDRFYKGLVDEVEIFDRALSASEIQAIYTAGSAGKCTFGRKTVNRSAVASGTPVIYTIALDNESEGNFDDVRVTDALPPTLTYIPGSLSATAGSVAYANGVISWNGPVNISGIVTITFGATVSQTAPVGTTIINSAVISEGGMTNTRSAKILVDSRGVYLPMIMRPQPSIAGRVTLNSAPVIEGVWLELRFYDGSAWSTSATTTTDSEGYYAFHSAPSLEPGQRYYVLYRNNAGTVGRLWVWGTRALTTYTAGSSVEIGNFDIADIILVSPPYGRAVALPYTFQWTPRPATPSDSYEFNLYDPTDLDPWFYSDPPLGYVGSFRLTGLPTGFSPKLQYAWEIWAYSPDGGSGISYEARLVTFSNSGSSITAPSASLPEKHWQLDEDFLRR